MSDRSNKYVSYLNSFHTFNPLEDAYIRDKQMNLRHLLQSARDKILEPSLVSIYACYID